MFIGMVPYSTVYKTILSDQNVALCRNFKIQFYHINSTAKTYIHYDEFLVFPTSRESSERLYQESSSVCKWAAVFSVH